MAEDPRSGRFANRSADAILAEARRVAADIRRRAERDASDIRRDAAEWAAATRREAEEYRDRLAAATESAESAGVEPAVIDLRPGPETSGSEPEPPEVPEPPAPPPDDAERREFVASYLAEHRRRRRWRTIAVALVAAAVLGAGAALVGLNLPDGEESDSATPVADVTATELVELPRDAQGRPLADVIAELDGSGLDFTFSRVHHEEVPAGAVISMTGATDGTVPRSTVVNLLVSKGPSARTVPDFGRGAHADTVVAAIEGLGLQPERRDTFDEQVPAGRVLAISPEPGSSVPRGETVTVTVSKGPDVVTVPDLAGRSLAEARALLEAAGLTPGEVHGHDHGVVVDQRPDAGATVRRGAPVNLRRA